jgi:hypothetical protein
MAPLHEKFTLTGAVFECVCMFFVCDRSSRIVRNNLSVIHKSVM